MEYNTYCLWLYDENDEVIGNDNPPEWDDDQELTDSFMAVSDLYDTFFVDNEDEFSYKGCPDKATAEQLQKIFVHAMEVLEKKNNGKYVIQNDVSIDADRNLI